MLHFTHAQGFCLGVVGAQWASLCGRGREQLLGQRIKAPHLAHGPADHVIQEHASQRQRTNCVAFSNPYAKILRSCPGYFMASKYISEYFAEKFYLWIFITLKNICEKVHLWTSMSVKFIDLINFVTFFFHRN